MRARLHFSLALLGAVGILVGARLHFHLPVRACLLPMHACQSAGYFSILLYVSLVWRVFSLSQAIATHSVAVCSFGDSFDWCLRRNAAEESEATRADPDDAVSVRSGRSGRSKTGGRATLNCCPWCDSDFTTTQQPILRLREKFPLLCRSRGYGPCDPCRGTKRWQHLDIGDKEHGDSLKDEDRRKKWKVHREQYIAHKNGGDPATV